MTGKNALVDALHDATHRLPGVPAHADKNAGHQGETTHGRTAHGRPRQAGRDSTAHAHHRTTGNHSPARPPRVLAGWQRRIAKLFGQEI